MKKAVSIILAVFCISLLHTYADNDKSNQCTVQIDVKKYLWQQGIERSLGQYVDAYLNLNSNTIEIDFSGLGEGEICIVDQNNHVLESVPVWENQNSAILSAWKSAARVTPEAQVPLTPESIFRMTPIKS